VSGSRLGQRSEGYAPRFCVRNRKSIRPVQAALAGLQILEAQIDRFLQTRGAAKSATAGARAGTGSSGTGPPAKCQSTFYSWIRFVCIYAPRFAGKGVPRAVPAARGRCREVALAIDSSFRSAQGREKAPGCCSRQGGGTGPVTAGMAGALSPSHRQSRGATNRPHAAIRRTVSLLDWMTIHNAPSGVAHRFVRRDRASVQQAKKTRSVTPARCRQVCARRDSCPRRRT